MESDLQRAELIAFPILFLLSLLFFRSLVAAVLPLLIGGLAIVSTFLLLTVASELASISIFALNLVTGLGLGLAIDYSLFVVSRYREEIAQTGAGMEALQAGRWQPPGAPSLYSSLTVAGCAGRARDLPAAVPLLDGDRRRTRGDRRSGDLADRAARHPRSSGRARQLTLAEVPAAPCRGGLTPRYRRASGTGSRAPSCGFPAASRSPARRS